MTNTLFQIEMEVRDYECDYHVIVNNAVYHNYFDHARHKFLIKQGINFNELINKKIFLVMFRSWVGYLTPLRYNDVFSVIVKYENVSRLKCTFMQEIMILKTKKKAAHCKIFATVINENNKPLLLTSIGINKEVFHH